MSEQEKIFTEGLIFKEPRAGAPTFIKGSLAIKIEDFTAFIKKYNNGKGWVNIDLKVSQNGKAYAELNTWQPTEQAQTTATPTQLAPTQATPPPAEMDTSDIPF